MMFIKSSSQYRVKADKEKRSKSVTLKDTRFHVGKAAPKLMLQKQTRNKRMNKAFIAFYFI